MPEKFLRAAIDWDGVVVEKKGAGDPRNWFKTGLKPNEGVQDGISRMAAQPDVQIMGIYTARPEWYRGRQTARQKHRFDIPVDTIHHIKGHYSAKVGQILEDAALPESRNEATLEPPSDLARVILIDDVHTKIMASVDGLLESPRFRPMLSKLTIVAFGPQNEDVQTGLVYPDTNLQVVKLRRWNEHDVDTMLDEVREHAA